MSSNTTNIGLYKADPVADKLSTFNIKTMLNDNWDNIDKVIGALNSLNTSTKVSLIAAINEVLSNQGALINLSTQTKENLVSAINEIYDNLTSGATVSPVIVYGMNNKITLTQNSSAPSFTIIGQSQMNLLGKDGNCEDVSRWTDWAVTHALDSTNKVFGNNGYKITLTSTIGNIYKQFLTNIDATKYYMLSAYLKNGNASAIRIKYMGATTPYVDITDTTGFNRVGIILQPSDIGDPNEIDIQLSGISGQYGWVDGISLVQISQDDYNQGVNYCLAKYPYNDSYSCLQNPYIEIKHDNLVRNGNCEEGIAWWTTYNASLSVVNNKFQLVTTASAQYAYEKINVKPNTNYYLSANIQATGAGTIQIYDSAITHMIITGAGTFNTGTNSQIALLLQGNGAGTTTYDSIMLTEGTIAPTEYLPNRTERTVLETMLTSDDSITFADGKVTGELWWKHKWSLYGKDYAWAFSSDQTGFKTLNISAPFSNRIHSGVNNNYSDYNIVKYDGKMILNSNGYSASDTGWFGATDLLGICVADTDSGWADTINPNNNEVIAFMNGWKAISNNGTRYTSWASVLDNSVPSGSISTNATGSNTAGQNILNVNNGSLFAINDTINVYHDVAGWGTYAITGISGNQLTLNTNLLQSVNNGGSVIKCDNGTTNTQLLTWCMDKVAPNYPGYQLHYKLATPETITDDNCQVTGDIPKFDVGDNYLYIDCGMVLDETVNPFNDNLGDYHINDSYNGGTNNNYTSYLKNKVELINTIYKNLIYDSSWTIGTSSLANGNYRAYEATANYDPTATYTVDYKILATIDPQIGTITCQYAVSVFAEIDSLQEQMETKQTHDSTLDNLVDLSMYEIINTNGNSSIIPSWACVGSTIYVDVVLPISYKKVVPTITINLANFWCNSVLINPYISVANKTVYDNLVVVQFMVTDATTVANIKSYGIYGYLNITADCRGRI